MEIVINRKYKKPDYTIGQVYIDGAYFCDSLEDTDRGLQQDMPIEEIYKRKVYGETAIPTGRYKVMLDWSPKFRATVPHIMNVPGFRGVRIHSGNSATDTLGCILLGKNSVRGKVVNSVATVRLFLQELQKAGGVADIVIR